MPTTPLDSTGKSLTLQDLVVNPESLSQAELHGAEGHKRAMSKLGATTGRAHSTVLELTTTPLRARGHTAPASARSHRGGAPTCLHPPMQTYL